MKKHLKLLAGMLLGVSCLVVLLLTAPRLLAATTFTAAPNTVNYQGYLTDSSGIPISGTVAVEAKIYDASTEGTLQWQEVHTDVQVVDGYFTLSLGSVVALTPSVFGGTPRYLQIGVNTDNNESGPFKTLPRQKFESVPYAYWATRSVTATHALTATTAMTASTAQSAPWSGLTDVPSGFADGSDDGSSYAQVVIVAKAGGHYTSVVEALNSFTATAESPYLVWVAPGVYTETGLIEVGAWTHLQGAGPNVTTVTSQRSGTVQNSDSATVRLYGKGRISDMSVGNSGDSSNFGIGIWMADDVTQETVVDNVSISVHGSGGVGHFAVYASDAEPTIQRSWLHARNASAVNAAFASVNSTGGGFPQALIENSVLLGAEEDPITCTDPTGTGFGMQMTESSPIVRDSYICGGHRAIFSGVNGNPIVHGSIVKVSSTNGAFLVETTASGIVSFGTSQLSYIIGAQTGLNTGAGSAPRCAQSYHGGTFGELDASCE